MNQNEPIFNQEAEQDLLGGLLIGGANAFDNIVNTGIVSDDFYYQPHKFIFSAIERMVLENKQIDVTTVDNELMSMGGFDSSQLSYLAGLNQNTPGSSNVKRYAEIVRECSVSRQAVDSARTLIENLYKSGGTNASQIISQAAKLLDDSLNSQQDDQSSFDTKTLMQIALDDFSDRYDKKGQISGTPTGFDSLDDVLNGLQKSDLVVVAGRPAMGKSAFAMSLARNVANNDEDGKVLVFNLEMSKQQIAMRELAAHAGVDMNHLKRGEDDDGQNFRKMEAVMGRIPNNMIVDTRVNVSLSQIRAKARKIKRQYGLKMIVIDYLQLISDSSKKHNTTNDYISFLSRQMKAIAKDLDVPLVLLSQLSRKVEERADKRPMMSDLRDSGAIEQDADVVLFLYRDDYYNTASLNKSVATVIVSKNRMGESGVEAHLKFEGAYSRFTNLEDGFVYDYSAGRKQPRRDNGV